MSEWLKISHTFMTVDKKNRSSLNGIIEENEARSKYFLLELF